MHLHYFTQVFTYEDIMPASMDSYHYSLLKTVNSAVWMIRKIPRKNQKSQYSFLICSYDKQNLQPVKISYYDNKKKLLKTTYLKGYRLFNGYWAPREISVLNHQNKRFSSFIWTKRKSGVLLGDHDFSPVYLRD